MHLSEVNNDPRLALEAARSAVGPRVRLLCAKQRETVCVEDAAEASATSQLALPFPREQLRLCSPGTSE
jgi:hypothetical protein